MATTEQRSRSQDGTKDVRFDAVGVTDIGRQRKHNEDHVLLRPELDLFVVADGMGGHNAGDIASKLATTSLRNFFEATSEGEKPEKRLLDGYDELSESAKRLAAGIRKANRDVFEISSTYRQHHGMGSTVVACYLARAVGQLHVGHVGDSRCYRFREGELEQLTHDHSLINDALALKPDLTPEELARLPKNIITRALGMREDVKVDIRSEDVLPGDIYLLCSDGLSGMIDEDDISNVLSGLYASEDSDLREACETLVTMANDAGGNDNITALLLRIDDLTNGISTGSAGAGSESEDAPDLEAIALSRMNTDELLALNDAEAAGAAEAGVADGADGADGEADAAGAGGADDEADAAGGAAGEANGDAGAVTLDCPDCGTQVESTNTFCTECGATLQV